MSGAEFDAKPVSCGVDVVAVERIADLIDRFGDSFLDRVYDDREVAYCRSQAAPEQHFAARWAAKEAAIKALPATDCPVTTAHVTVRRESGAPELALAGPAAEAAAGTATSVSLSHDRTLGAATAQVVLLAAEREGVSDA